MPCGEVNLEFFKSHVGNQCELGQMRLSKGKEDISKNIALNIPFDNILDNISSSQAMKWNVVIY